VVGPIFQNFFDFIILGFELLLVNFLILVVFDTNYLNTIGPFYLKHLRRISTGLFSNGLETVSMRVIEKAFHVIIIIWLKEAYEYDLLV
jgi:hypothetical protein